MLPCPAVIEKGPARMKYPNRNRRPGFTLIELIVAMGIMMFIAALTVAMLPRMSDNIRVAAAADKLQGWLLAAKQRATRRSADGPAAGSQYRRRSGCLHPATRRLRAGHLYGGDP